jgi:chondroitin-sulfate-ABC endolyase/exolyase
MIKKFLILSISLALSSVFAEPMIDFSGKDIPDFVKCYKSKVAVTDIRAIQGRQSLRWDWSKNATLTFNMPIPYFTDKEASKVIRRRGLGTFSIWVYNTKALPDSKIRFEFGKERKVNCYFDFNLNFTGWRTCWVAYTRDMKGKPVSGMDFMKIVAPKNVSSGTLFFDRVIFCSAVDYRHHVPDAQVPFVNLKQVDMNTPRMDFYRLAPARIHPLTAVEKAGFETLEKRLKTQILHGVNAVDFKKLKRAFSETRITEKDGVLNGRHVKFGSHNEICAGVKGGKKYLKEYLGMRYEYGALMLNLAIAWNKDQTGEHASEIKKMFVLMTKHMLDQGWAPGSGLGTMHHQGYCTREMLAALFLMSKPLSEAGLLKQASNMAQWFNNVRYIFNKKYWPTPNADYFNTISRSAIMSLVMMPDSPEKAASIKAFSKFYSHVLGMESPGWMGGLKADGCFFHHWGNYPGYSFPAMRASAFICYLLSDTPWQISTKARNNLRRALYAAYLYCNPNTAMALCGRHPFGEEGLDTLESAFKYFAKADGGRKVRPQKLPQGHWSFNYGCFGVHRYKDKMVTLKGYNRFVWSSEIYKRDNRFGRYQSNGTVEIMPKSGPVYVGRVQEGWDWNRNPGATILYRPFEILNSPIFNTTMLTTSSRISGSSNLENKYGMLAVELSEPKLKNFDPKFKAVKSTFCFDDRIICLGSGITAACKYPAETVLTQYNVKDGSVPIYFNTAKAITKLSFTAEHKNPSWVADAFGNAWFVVSGGKVKVERKKQSSPHNKTLKVSSGYFASAWIEHGVRPKNAGYEYLILIDTTPEKASKFATEMKTVKPYNVLRCDNYIQAVYDKSSKVTAAVFFKAASNLKWGPLNAVKNPSYVMFRQQDNTLSLSINTPDMAGFIRGEKKNSKELLPRQVSIVLNGKWRAEKLDKRADIKVIGNSTVITGKFVHGIPIQLKLVQI